MITSDLTGYIFTLQLGSVMVFSRGQTGVLLGLPVLANAALYNQIVQTETGPVYGYPAFNSTPSGGLTNWKDIAVWKGIPFAATTANEVGNTPLGTGRTCHDRQGSKHVCACVLVLIRTALNQIRIVSSHLSPPSPGTRRTMPNHGALYVPRLRAETSTP